MNNSKLYAGNITLCSELPNPMLKRFIHSSRERPHRYDERSIPQTETSRLFLTKRPCFHRHPVFTTCHHSSSCLEKSSFLTSTRLPHSLPNVLVLPSKQILDYSHDLHTSLSRVTIPPHLEHCYLVSLLSRPLSHYQWFEDIRQATVLLSWKLGNAFLPCSGCTWPSQNHGCAAPPLSQVTIPVSFFTLQSSLCNCMKPTRERRLSNRALGDPRWDSAPATYTQFPSAAAEPRLDGAPRGSQSCSRGRWAHGHPCVPEATRGLTLSLPSSSLLLSKLVNAKQAPILGRGVASWARKAISLLCTVAPAHGAPGETKGGEGPLQTGS